MMWGGTWFCSQLNVSNFVDFQLEPLPIKRSVWWWAGWGCTGWKEGWERTVDGMQILQKLVHYRYMYFFKINFQVVWIYLFWAVSMLIYYTEHQERHMPPSCSSFMEEKRKQRTGLYISLPFLTPVKGCSFLLGRMKDREKEGKIIFPRL